MRTWLGVAVAMILIGVFDPIMPHRWSRRLVAWIEGSSWLD